MILMSFIMLSIPEKPQKVYLRAD